MEIDIEYLLWLQNFRESTDNILTPFFNLITTIAAAGLIVIPIFIYWCINKRSGLYILVSIGISRFINSILKLTFCVYRPWIRDSRIIPDKVAIKDASGYSFPSGHVMDSTPIYGGLAVLCRKKAAFISWLCALMIILTALSRNYLGVHTPQDVLVGVLMALFSLWLTSKIFAYIYIHPEKENIFMITGLIMCVIVLLYAELKSYPMDYDSKGKLIVNYDSMIKSSLPSIGEVAGLILGRYLDRKYINFQHTGFNFKGVFLALMGITIYYLIFIEFRHALFNFNHATRLVRGLLSMMYITALWPAVIKFFVKVERA